MSEWIPREHDKVAVKWLLTHPEALLFLEPGLGKTAIALSSFAHMQRARGVKKALVIAPRAVCYNVWTHEVGGELWKYKKSFGHLRVALLHGPDKEEALEADADIYVINPDGLQWLLSDGRLKSLFKRGVDCLIIDELSKFKHRSTKRFKLLRPHLGRFRRRWGMTGSPAANGLLDLFGQVYTIDLGRSLGQYFSHFRQKYFLPTGFMGKKWVPQDDGEKRIYKALKPIALSMKATDHLDLPAVIEQDIYVRLPAKAQAEYAKLEDIFFIELDGGTVTAANAAVAGNKCRQAASGALYLDDEDPHKRSARKWAALHDEKVDALVDLVDELQGSPLLIAYDFDHDFQRIDKALGGDTPVIRGGTNPKEARALVQAWNAGELPVLCGHPLAMGHGLNLQASGHHVCWYSLTWNYELYDQLNRRVWRSGQKHRVFVHRFLARDTVDEAVAKAITMKRMGQESLLRALKNWRSSRGL